MFLPCFAAYEMLAVDQSRHKYMWQDAIDSVWKLVADTDGAGLFDPRTAKWLR